jgi:small subunit ribosomal protein S16
MGRRHVPFYRINAIEKRTKRDGKVLENLGWYDPSAPDKDKQVLLKTDRIKHWLEKGAQPSDTMMDMFAKVGLVDAAAWTKVRSARVEAKKKSEAAKAAAAASAAAGGEKKEQKKAE